DFPLSERGSAQARAAGEWLLAHHPEVIIASPMARARRTAEIVAQTAGCERLQFSDFLIEIDTGIFSGMEAQAAAQAYPDIHEEFRARSWDAVPDAESSMSMYARAMRSWMEIKNLALSGMSRIVCVTHGGLLQWMIKSSAGSHAWLPLFPMSNCGISLYEIEPNGAGRPAFVQWAALNFHPPSMPQGPKPVF
ncbi:MAG: histidine phosphatase family protein, partial [Rectinema sp.]|nr:histidine phosphatase family protein [Rectinema sp.]